MTLTLTILGCGSSAGVPRPALGWGACDPNNPKNRRRRCSLLAERTSDRGTTRVLIDTRKASPWAAKSAIRSLQAGHSMTCPSTRAESEDPSSRSSHAPRSGMTSLQPTLTETHLSHTGRVISHPVRGKQGTRSESSRSEPTMDGGRYSPRPPPIRARDPPRAA